MFTYFPCALYNKARPGAWKKLIWAQLKELFSASGIKAALEKNAKGLFFYILSFIKGLSGGAQEAIYTSAKTLGAVAVASVKAGGLKKLFTRMASDKIAEIRKMTWDEVALKIIEVAAKIFMTLAGDAVKAALSQALGGADVDIEAKFGFDFEIPLEGANTQFQCSNVTKENPISTVQKLPGGIKVAFVQESSFKITTPEIPTPPVGSVKTSCSTSSSSDLTLDTNQ